MSTSCSIFFHNYYGQHQNWIRFFCEKMNVPFNLFYNIVEDSLYNIDEQNNLYETLHNQVTGPFLKQIILRKSPNLGKDIGGKLILLDSFLHLQFDSEYIIFLHDKKSPHTIQYEVWQKKLFRIVEPFFIEKALKHFKENAKTGIVGGSDCIKDEFDHSRQMFVSNNHAELLQLQSELGIHPSDFRYIEGTMFWARSFPLLNFFKNNPPLEIRKTLERGNIMDEKKGTITHAWERLLSWIIVAQHYNIKGI